MNEDHDKDFHRLLEKMSRMQQLMHERLSEKRQALITRFPELCRDLHMFGDISIDLGWYPLVESLSQKLQALSDQAGCQVRGHQIKQKFGRLCYYYELDPKATSEFSDSVYNLVRAVERESTHTCEICGTDTAKTASVNLFGWVRTLCDPCMGKLQEEKEREGALPDEYLDIE